LLFGNPKLGTPLMRANRQVAIDLPMKMLVWEDDAGKVWIGYTSAETLKMRYKQDRGPGRCAEEHGGRARSLCERRC
jgi:uncharacterized protein (DUF302 family)